MYMARILEESEKTSEQTIIKSSYLERQFCLYCIQNDMEFKMSIILRTVLNILIYPVENRPFVMLQLKIIGKNTYLVS